MKRVSRESFSYGKAGTSIPEEKSGDILLFQVGPVHSFVTHRRMSQRLGGLPNKRLDLVSEDCVEPGPLFHFARLQIHIQVPHVASRFIQSFGVFFLLGSTRINAMVKIYSGGKHDSHGTDS